MFNRIRKFDYLLGKILYAILCARVIKTKWNTSIPADKISKILCIKLWGLGNLTIIYPLVYRIKEKYPQAHLIFMTFDINRGFLERHEAVDRIIYFKFTTNLFLILKQCIMLAMTLRKEKIDVLVNFETFNHTSAFLSFLTRAPVRIGLYNKFEKIFYNYPVYNENSVHLSQLFSSLIRPLGLNSEYRYYSFKSLESDEKKIKFLIERLGFTKFICVHPGTSANFRGKRYKIEKFAKLLNLLIEKHRMPVVFTGTSCEGDIVRAIIDQLVYKEETVNLAAKLTLWELIELLKKTYLLISADTAPVHLAASLGINLAVFYGPTSPQRYRPLNHNSLSFFKAMECSPCIGIEYRNNNCKYSFACLDFSPQEIFSAISERFLS